MAGNWWVCESCKSMNLGFECHNCGAYPPVQKTTASNSASGKSLDDIINECQKPKIVEKECPRCFGGGMEIIGTPNGPSEIKCDKCYGEGYIEEEE